LTLPVEQFSTVAVSCTDMSQKKRSTSTLRWPRLNVPSAACTASASSVLAVGFALCSGIRQASSTRAHDRRVSSM
jgi:hypothetical protein